MAKRKNRSTGHSSVLGAAAMQEELAQEAVIVRRFERWVASQDEDELDIVSIRVRWPIEEGGEYMAVLSAWVEGERKVAFNTGGSFQEALLGVMKRAHNKSIKWKDDQYA